MHEPKCRSSLPEASLNFNLFSKRIYVKPYIGLSDEGDEIRAKN